MTLWVMFGTMLMAAALPMAFSGHAMVFAGACVAIHLGPGLFLVSALGGRQAHRHAGRFLFWFAVSAVPWLAGSIVAGTARGLLWAAALALDYALAWLRYPTPGHGRVPTSQYEVAADHLAERYQQLPEPPNRRGEAARLSHAQIPEPDADMRMRSRLFDGTTAEHTLS